MKRTFWFLAGLTALAFGLIGVILPLLPSVPFAILAAYCFARSSDRLHDWLLAHRIYGPAIKDWRERGAIARRGKIWATISIAIVYAISLILALPLWLLLVQGVAIVGVLAFIWSRPD